ncbi:MAG: monooxygenase, partial [Nannocystaceae bacterium]
TGIRVEPGSKAVLQVHYNTQVAGSEQDQSKIGFRIDEEVEREGAVVAFLNGYWFIDPTSMGIPAGEESVTHSFQAPLGEALYNPIEAPRFEVHSLLPHMHKLGRQIRLSKQSASGSEILLNVPDYDFNWQRDYVFETPVVFENTDELLLECTWNNTKQWRARVGAQPVEPIDVGWGEGTVDEMCVAALYVTAAK